MIAVVANWKGLTSLYHWSTPVIWGRTKHTNTHTVTTEGTCDSLVLSRLCVLHPVPLSVTARLLSGKTKPTPLRGGQSTKSHDVRVLWRDLD